MCCVGMVPYREVQRWRGNPVLPHTLQPTSAARGRPCAWHSCRLHPRQRTALHITRVPSSYRYREISWVALAKLRRGSLRCYHRTSAGPCPPPYHPPCFLPNSQCVCFAPQDCPLTQAEPFLGSSTSQMSKTGKIFPPPPRESHIVLLLV